MTANTYCCGNPICYSYLYSSTSNHLYQQPPPGASTGQCSVSYTSILYLLAESGVSPCTLDREELRDQAMDDGGVQVAQCIGHEQRELTQRE